MDGGNGDPPENHEHEDHEWCSKIEQKEPGDRGPNHRDDETDRAEVIPDTAHREVGEELTDAPAGKEQAGTEVYADLASAVPFPNTIEGLVYLEEEYVSHDAFLAIQFEAVVYSVLFGLSVGWFLF